MAKLNRLLLLIGTCVLLPATLATPAAGDVVETLTGTVSPPKAGAPSTLHIVGTIADTSGAKPPQVRRLLMRFPRGGRVDARAAGRCNVARLQTTGNCPARSRVGRGTATVDVRFGSFSTLDARLTIYNVKPFQPGDKAGLMFHAEEPQTGSTVNIRGRVYVEPAGNPVVLLSNIELPQILSVQPVVSRLDVTSGKRIRTTSIKRVRGKKRRVRSVLSYITNPPRCDGTWTVTAEYTYDAELLHTLTQSVPCRA